MIDAGAASLTKVQDGGPGGLAAAASAYALKEDAEKFRIVSDAAISAIIMLDNDGKISFWNKAAEKIFGYSVGEAMGQDWRPLIIPERYREANSLAFHHFRTTGQGAAFGKTQEVTALRKNGSEFPAELSLSASNNEGNWIAVAIVRDISERKLDEDRLAAQIADIAKINARLMETNEQLKKARNQLLQSEKMASIGLLAAGVAHEINNPVGYVYANLGTLEKYLADIFAMVGKYEQAERLLDDHTHEIEEIREFRKQIDFAYVREDIQSLLAESREGLMRVKKIVLDLKDFSHTGSDEEWQWVDLVQGLESTLNVVWNELKYKCEVRKEYVKLPLIRGLASQLNQVFMNLLVNAAQAIEKRGIVAIRSGQEGDQVWVEVADTGTGIPPENLPRLFDPFFTTKPVGHGTGLGLSVSYSIVEKHHGRIEVTSEVGKGSTFRVWLPVKQDDAAEPWPETHGPAGDSTQFNHPGNRP